MFCSGLSFFLISVRERCIITLDKLYDSFALMFVEPWHKKTTTVFGDTDFDDRGQSRRAEDKGDDDSDDGRQ